MSYREEAPHAPSCASFQRKPIARTVREFRYPGSPSTKNRPFCISHLQKTKDLLPHCRHLCHPCRHTSWPPLLLAALRPQSGLGANCALSFKRSLLLPLTPSARSFRASLLSPRCAGRRTATRGRAPPYTRTGPTPRAVFPPTGTEGRAALWLDEGHVLHIYFLSRVQRLLLKLVPFSVSLSIAFKRATVQHSRSSALHKVRHKPHLTMGGFDERQSLAWHLSKAV